MRFNKLMIMGALGVTLLATAASCGSPKEISYFQDFYNNPDTVLSLSPRTITVKPSDKLYIGVKSKDEQLTQLFSLQGASSYSVGTSVGKDAYYYTVDKNGDIDFPVVGKIHIGGMTRDDVATTVKQRLMASNLVKDPTVTVAFGNLTYSVMGEVQKPGKFEIEKDQVTILDALSQAGDLTIYGRRDDVMVLRQENGHQKIYTVNLTSGKNVVNSPVYYLQQDDVIYVNPNDAKARQSTVNGNNIRSTGFWISLASLATSVAVLIKK